MTAEAQLDAVSAGPEAIPESEKTMVLVAYVMYVLGPFLGITAIVGVIMNHIKMGDSKSLFAKSHHRWMMRTFWFGLLGGIIGGLLSLFGIGLFVILVVGIWYLYRIIRGLLAFFDKKPMPMPA